jgi:4-hydroxy-3-methylbut-2-enyl diphosphate reductase
MNMAIQASESSSETIYTLGPLVHNNDAVDMLRKNDVMPAKDPDELHDKKVFIRAHGVPPSVKDDLAARHNTIIDATCPYVLNVQNIAKEYAEKGYSVIIVGDRGHAEVEGLLGYCGGRGHVVPDIKGVAELPDLKKVCVIAQTTQNRENFFDVINGIEKRFKNVIIENTICGATSIRQKEVLELVELVDLMIVVGGRHSANTKRLEELSLSTGTPTILIENASQLDVRDIKRYGHIGITAGASTPSWVIEEVTKKVESVESSAAASLIDNAINLIIDTSTFLSIGSVFLYYGIAYFLGVPAFSDIKLPVIIFLFISAVHFLNSSYIEKVKPDTSKGEKAPPLRRFGVTISVIYLLVSLVLSYFLHGTIFLIHLFLCVSGLVYSKIKLPKPLVKIIKFKSLKDIPASKDIFQSIAWVIIIVGYPAIFNDIDLMRPKVPVAAFFVGCIVFARSIVYDIKEIRLDKMIGKETLPVLLGEGRSKICLITLLGILMAGLLYTKVKYLAYIKINLFLVSLLYILVYLYLFHKKIVYKGYILHLIIDGQFYFIGIVTYLFYV